MSRPELHQELKRLGQEIPTIFITGHRDENTWLRVGALPLSSAVRTLFIVDDDASVRESLEVLIRNERTV